MANRLSPSQPPERQHGPVPAPVEPKPFDWQARWDEEEKHLTSRFKAWPEDLRRMFAFKTLVFARKLAALYPDIIDKTDEYSNRKLVAPFLGEGRRAEDSLAGLLAEYDAVVAHAEDGSRIPKTEELYAQIETAIRRIGYAVVLHIACKGEDFFDVWDVSCEDDSAFYCNFDARDFLDLLRRQGRAGFVSAYDYGRDGTPTPLAPPDGTPLA